MGIVLERIGEFGDSPFIYYRGRRTGYEELAASIGRWLERFPSWGIEPGAVVSVAGHFSPDWIALVLALLENRNIVVPFDDEAHEDLAKRQRVAQVKYHFGAAGHASLPKTADGDHPLIERLRDDDHAGIILFTSGSTGESKAAVHSFARLIEKHVGEAARKPMNTMVFLKFDHIGGVNTMLWVLMNGGCMVAVEDRSPNAVCRLIEEARVEILPATPSFLNMLILSRAWEKYDLSSLKVITYGTEPMPESTLQAAHKHFPAVALKQTYGLTELGIFSTRSRSGLSTFMAIREDDARTKIENGILYIKAKSAMLGYLNAASPFDADGWYNTGDRVVVEDGYTRVLGRESEIINVGGEKVFPSEVESILLEMDNVVDVTVLSKVSPVVGQIVAAIFKLEREEELVALRMRVWAHCRSRLEGYKIPREISITSGDLVSTRFKRIRRFEGETTSV